MLITLIYLFNIIIAYECYYLRIVTMNRVMYLIAVIIAVLHCFASGEHLDAVEDLTKPTSLVASSGVIHYAVSSSLDKSNPETEYEYPRTADGSENSPPNFPNDESVGFIPHELDVTGNSWLPPPITKTVTISTLLITTQTQGVVMDIQTMASYPTSYLLDDVPASNLPSLQTGSTDTVLPHLMETTVWVTTIPHEGNGDIGNFDVNIPFPIETPMPSTVLPLETTATTSTDGIWDSGLTISPESPTYPSQDSTTRSERVIAINATSPGGTIETAPAESKAKIRTRPNWLSLSFLMFAATVFLGRDKKHHRPPGYRSPDTRSTATKRARKPREPGWEERTLVIYGLDRNESVLAALERDTPVSDEKEGEVYAALVLQGEIVEITFLNQDEAVVEWEEKESADWVMGRRVKPEFQDQEVGAVWYNDWEAFCREREDDVTVRNKRRRIPDETKRPGSERRQRERAAAILRRAQAALKNVFAKYESEEATDLLDDAEAALERAQEQEEEEEKRRNDGQPEGSKSGGAGTAITTTTTTTEEGKVGDTAMGHDAKSEYVSTTSKGKEVDDNQGSKESEPKFPESDASKERTMQSAFQLLRRAQDALKNDTAIGLLAEAQRTLREETRESKLVQAAELLSEARETLMREAKTTGRGVTIPIPDAEPVGDDGGAGGGHSPDTPSPELSSSSGGDGAPAAAAAAAVAHQNVPGGGGGRRSESSGEEEQQRGRTRLRMFERYEMARLQS